MSKKVIAISAVAALALVLLWYFAVFSNQSKSLNNAHAQLSAARSEATSLRGQIATLQQEKLQLPAAQNKLNILELALPNTPALDKLIDDINAAATRAGVDWRTVNPSKPATYLSNGVAASGPSALPGGMQAVNVTLSVGGTYQQVMAFVTNLNSMSRLLDVDSVNLSGVGGSGASTAQISAQIFFVPTAGSTTATAVAP